MIVVHIFAAPEATESVRNDLQTNCAWSLYLGKRDGSQKDKFMSVVQEKDPLPTST